MIRIRVAIALAELFLASPAVAEEGATTGDLRLQCLSRDPILHQHCLSYIAGVYEMTGLMGEVQLSSFELVSFGSSKQIDGQVHFLGFAEEASACSLVKGAFMRWGCAKQDAVIAVSNQSQLSPQKAA